MDLVLFLKSKLVLLDRARQSLSEGVGEPWKTIIVSRQPLMVGFQWCLFVLWMAIPLLTFRIIIYSLLPIGFYQRDLIQEYLLAKALFAGEDLYLPLTELAKQFTPDLPVVVFSHPTPHPPLIALLFLPLAKLMYEQAVIVWFVIDLVCVVLVSYLIVYWLGRGRNWKEVALLSVIIITWEPFVTDIVVGQLSSFLLLFLLGSWLCLRKNRDVLGGFFLGLVFTLKLMAWPIIIYLILQKRWRAVIASGSVVAGGNILMGILIGFDDLLYYYLSIGPAVSAIYRGDIKNFSVFSTGWKLFGGFDSLIAPIFHQPPLVESLSFLAPYMAILFSLVFTGVGLYFSVRSRAFDIAFGILVCISVLANPVSWIHYFTWLIIPLAVLGRYLYEFEFPHLELKLTLVCLVLLLYSWTLVSFLVHAMGGFNIAPVFLYLMTWLLYLPVLGVLILIGTLVRIDKRLI